MSADTLPPCADITDLVVCERALRAASPWPVCDVVALVRPRAPRAGLPGDFVATLTRWETREGVRVRPLAEVRGTGRTPERATRAAIAIIEGRDA